MDGWLRHIIGEACRAWITDEKVAALWRRIQGELDRQGTLDGPGEQ